MNAATLTSRMATVWDSEKFRGVMVPGAGSYTAYEIGRAIKNDQSLLADMQAALVRAERKLAAYVGVCNGDKELTDTVLPMVRAALSKAQVQS